ncbi:MAG: transglutaminase domain-containing protein [Oscillospiraceae bacterium]|nr:transglutaminase domain-containing protein [Oscillospiraceae bacterium]
MKRSNYAKSSSGGAKRTAFALIGGLLLIVLCGVLLLLVLKGGNQITAQTSTIDYAKSEIAIYSGEPLPTADAFLYDNTRQYIKAARFLVVPEDKQGNQDIAILMQLDDGTTRTENAVLTIREPVITWELGTEADIKTLLGEEYADSEMSISLKDITKVGSYDTTVKIHGSELPFTLVAQDTVPPVVKLYDKLSFYVNQKLTAADFVESCEDLCPVEYHFSEEPSTMIQGTFHVQLIVTDSSGNSTTADADFTVSGDGEPPILSGVTDMKTIVGIPIGYMRDVKAVDAHDGETEVIASEPEGFSLRKAGDYTITYTSTDEAGNTATETATLHVLASIDDVERLSEEDVLRMGDYIISTIDREGRTDREYLRMLYNYVQGHMVYHDSKHKYDWAYSAVEAIFQGYGDCRNYYGLSRLLLTSAGFENMMVEKPKPNEHTNAHFWNLVKVDGAWYHFDTTPRFNRSDFFLWTDAQMDAFSAKNNGCFERDRSLYPATPE